MTALEILKAMRVTLPTSEQWTKNAYARNLFGTLVPADHIDAVCWCLVGAASKVAHTPFERERAMQLLARQISGDPLTMSTYPEAVIIEWQDAPARTFQDALNILHRAIAEEEAR